MAVPKKKPLNYMILPPPATAVAAQPNLQQMQQMLLGAPAQVATPGTIGPVNPAMANPGSRSFVPIELPPAPAAPQRSDFMADDSGLQADRASALERYNRAVQGANDPAQYSVQQPQQSDFEKMLQQHTEQEIMKNLSQGDSRGDRFQRGFNMGQQIASSVAIPIMGLMGGTGAGAGAMESARAIQSQVAQNRALQQQEKHQRNAVIQSLASTYENISPTSAKNVRDLIARKLQVDQLNRQSAKDAEGSLTTAAGQLSGIDHNLASMKQNGVNSFRQADGAYQQNLLGRAALGEKLNSDTVAAQDKNLDNARADESLKVSQGQLKLSGDRLAQDKINAGAKAENDKANLGVKNTEIAQRATNDLLKESRLHMQDMMKVNGQGQPTYQGWKDYLKGNKILKQSFEKKMKLAGIDGTAEDLFNLATAPDQAPAQGTDYVGNFASGVGNTLKSLFGGGQQQVPQVPAVPPMVMQAVKSGAVVYKNGKWVPR